ncbi:MAG: arginase [Flavobacteriales bacterium]|nr:arginase [Flavobacteriales bacterium]MCB9447924.1 arginase [Flavobacteriales bacterium]
MTDTGLTLVRVQADLGAGKKGAAQGAAALLEAARSSHVNTVLALPQVEIPLIASDDPPPDQTPFSKHIDVLLGYQRKVAEQITGLLHTGQLPIVISGDHSSAAGVIAGLKAAHPGERLGVIWIDAHADMHSPYTTPSGNLHGMPLAASLGEDNLACAIRQPDEHTIQQWNAMKNMASVAPKILGDDLCFIGVRSTEKAEDVLIKQHRIRNYTVNEVRSKGVPEIAEEVLKQLAHCTRIFVSFDVDCMDPSVSSATGTPVENGFFLEEARELVRTLLASPSICCFEITEINPTLEAGDQMARAALDVLKAGMESLTHA